ncbi:Tetratricopeptide repeat [Phytophthora cactorum]|nr:Tetratricopeptide repeat [Phytophthora cactorum]
MATRMKMQMNLKMNANNNSSSSSSSEDTRLLRTGIDQYRSLQHLNTTTNTRRSRGSAERAAERGVALMERKQFGAAIPYLTEALETLSSSSSDLGTKGSAVKLYHQRGLCYLASKKYKPAIEDLSRVMQLTPKSSELYAKRGKAYAALGEHHAAMLDYNEAISLAATQGLLNDCGRMEMVYKAMNNITHALEDLSHAENSAGGHRDVELFYERAQLYLQCHQDPLALRDFDRFIELQEEAEESRHFDASGGVGGLAGFVSPQEMQAEPRARMLDVLLERAKLLQRMALEEDARERKDAELAAVEQGQSRRSPKTGKSGSKLAYTSVPPKPEPYRGIESRRLEKRALEDYSRALELDPSNVETLRLRGESFMHLARYEEALADFAAALEVDPHDFQLRAQLYEELGAIKEAEKDYSSIIHAHFDNPGVDDAASGKVTMELASGGTVNLGQGKGKPGKAGGTGKITSEVAAQALLCRARLRLANDQFDAAEEDYQEILKSFANNMEAQLELQETRERKVAFEERKQREALAWLEQNADDMDGAGVLNANGNATSGKNKKKKKKKKKKSNSSSANTDKPPAGYVFWRMKRNCLSRRGKSSEYRSKNRSRKRPKRRIEMVKQQNTESEAVKLKENVSVDKVDEEVSVKEVKQDIVVANVMTRDEAWESMWDEESDEPLEAGAVRIQIQAHSDDAEDETETAARMDDVSLPEHEEISKVEDSTPVELPLVASNGDEEANDEASGSSEDGKDSHGKAKAVLHASDERDKSAIDEALARAERKQMSSALQEDIQRARDVLADMAETQRLLDLSPPSEASSSPSGIEHGRKHLHTVTPTTSPSNTSSGSSKPPSLVIRPIAYGQALQAAEQHQQQLRAHQKLLEEKDAEIAELKTLLAQKEAAPQEDARSIEARAQAKAAALARRVSRLRTQFPVQSAAARQTEALVEWMGPSDAADRVRQQVLSFVQRVITAHFPLAAAPLFFATGSYPMKTYLPGSDLDICLLVPQELESSWYYIVTQALCVAGGSGGVGTVLDLGNPASSDGSGSSSPSGVGAAVGSGGGPLLLTNTVRNVTFINADVRVVKCTVDNIPVDFTANRVGALGAVRLLDAMAALYLFLDRLAEFPWHESALTLHGAVPLSRLATTPLNGATSHKSKLKAAKLDAGDVEAIRIHPLDDKNNLARSVSAEGFPVMKRAFRLARDQLAAMLAPRSSHKDDDTELLSEETSNDTDLAREGRVDVELGISEEEQGIATTSTSSVANSDEDEDRRWESLLPSLDAGTANTMLLQHQQLQQQAAAAAAYHGTMIPYQQPYYSLLQQHGPPMSSGSTSAGPVAMANGVPNGPTPTATEQLSYYQTLRRPYGSPGGNAANRHRRQEMSGRRTGRRRPWNSEVRLDVAAAHVR